MRRPPWRPSQPSRNHGRESYPAQPNPTILSISHHTNTLNQTLEINITSEPFWPDICNHIIPLYGNPETKRTYFQGIQSTLNGDPAENPMFGFTEAIAHPYGGFAGWTRICFAICEEPDDDSDSDVIMEDGDDSEDNYWVHAYEGVILPGGRIMLGRWMDLKNMDASGRGPFIFWDL